MKNNNQNQIVSAIIVAAMIVGGAILLKDSEPREILKKPQDTVDINSRNSGIKAVSNQDHILGNKNAKIVIVEYSDMECPYCQVFHNTMHEIIKEKTNIAWVYRHYPIAGLHSKAIREAEATECAFEQGGNTAFWKYVDRIFEITPSNNRLEEKELTNTAQYIGLNTSSFYTCLESRKYQGKIEDDINNARKDGIKSTPHSFILVNGKVVDVIRGAKPYEEIINQLNKLE